VAALITLAPEALEQWTGVPEEELERQVARAVAAANSTVSRSESIRAFRILPREFGEDTGLLTPSMKVRRDATAARYAHEINALYAR
jgi:long-chain acyl-CoA synthetase